MDADLRAAARRARVTPHILVLAAYGNVLAQAFDRDDLVVGCAVHGRTQPEFHGLGE